MDAPSQPEYPLAPEFSLNFRDLLTFLFKHQTKILTVFLITVITVTIGSFLWPPVYEAYASILVKIGRENIYRPEVGTELPRIAIDREAALNSEINIVTSQDLITQVIQEIGVKQLYPELWESPPSDMTLENAALREFDKNLSVGQVKASNVIEIWFQHESPTMAAQAVNQLIDLLKERHLKIFSAPKASFLEQQVEAFDNKLNESKAHLQQFKQVKGLSSFEEENRLLLEQRNDLDEAANTAQHELKGVQSKLFTLRKQMKNTPQHVPLKSVSDQQHLAIDRAKSDLLDHKRKQQMLLTRYKPTSRLVLEIEEEIELIEMFIREQEHNLAELVTTGTNPVYQELEMEAHRAEGELQALQAEEKTLRQQIQILQNRLAEHEKQGKELHAFEDQVAMDKQNYELYVNKMEEARISEKMDQHKMANLSIIQSAKVPAKPVTPRKGLNIFLSILVGGISGILLALFSEYAEGGYSRPEHVAQHLNIPILTSINYKRGNYFPYGS